MPVTDICCVCTGLVATIDGLLVEHRHREQFGPCPGGQAEPEQEWTVE